MNERFQKLLQRKNFTKCFTSTTILAKFQMKIEGSYLKNDTKRRF